MLLGVLMLAALSCTQKSDKGILEKALSSQHENIRRVMDSVEPYELQIRYTQIDRLKDSIVFNDFDFQIDRDNYFYPASTVKFPAAVAALEKLNEIDSVDRNSKFFVEGDSVTTTFARAIQEIFAVSDNVANNRLVEFLGFDELNQRIQQRGVTPIRISHRLSTSDADNVTTRPLLIYKDDSTTFATAQIINQTPLRLNIKKVKKGSGFFAGDSLYHEPFDFGFKNYYPIEAQSALLKRIVFPEAFEKANRFNLSKDQHAFLLNTMASLPYQLGYDRDTYYDSYVKFFLFGDSKAPMPKNVKIYNKVGYAYGTLTDCAYIVDDKNDVEFILVATLLVNEDKIFNDDNYEYEEVGIPFLAQLGREIYQEELKR